MEVSFQSRKGDMMINLLKKQTEICKHFSLYHDWKPENIFFLSHSISLFILQCNPPQKKNRSNPNKRLFIDNDNFQLSSNVTKRNLLIDIMFENLFSNDFFQCFLSPVEIFFFFHTKICQDRTESILVSVVMNVTPNVTNQLFQFVEHISN